MFWCWRCKVRSCAAASTRAYLRTDQACLPHTGHVHAPGTSDLQNRNRCGLDDLQHPLHVLTYVGVPQRG